MKVLEVVGRNVRLLRQQHGMSQAAMADLLSRYGVHLDPTAVLRIEKGARDLKVDELLAFASALLTHPADLLAPPDGERLELGEYALDGAQVFAWLSGDAAAPLTAQRSREDFERRGKTQYHVQYMLELLEAYVQAEDADDEPAAIHATSMLASYAAGLTEQRYGRSLPAEHRADRFLTQILMEAFQEGRS